MEDKQRYSRVQSESDVGDDRDRLRGFQRGWDCSLNICVVPPHIYMSLFAR